MAIRAILALLVLLSPGFLGEPGNTPLMDPEAHSGPGPAAEAFALHAPGLRLATEAERAANGWPAGTYLSEGPLVAVADDTATLLVPDAGTWHEVALPLVKTWDVDAVSIDGVTGEILAADETTLRSFEADGLRVVSASDGGLSANADLPGVELQYVPFEPVWVVETPFGLQAPTQSFDVLVAQAAVPGITLLGPCPSAVPALGCDLLWPACSDGIDNDGDGWTDADEDTGCDGEEDDNEYNSRQSMAFGLIGEMKWCSRFPYNWKAHMGSTGDDIEDVFDASGERVVPNPYHAAEVCFHGTISAANTCDTTTNCSNYPFSDCESKRFCYPSRVGSALYYARQSQSIPGLKFAQVTHYDVVYSSGGSPYCGYATGVGTSVSVGMPNTETSCPRYVWSHEVGHNFEATHSDGIVGTGGDCSTVMIDFGCKDNHFSRANRWNVNYCSTSSSCPRSGTL